MSWASQYRGILDEIITKGEPVTAGETLSVGSTRTTLELLNHSFASAAPTDRLLPGPAPRFDLAAAIGRFLWMVRGSDRLAEIAYYDPRAARFSDDGYTVPGSSDGARLFNPRPGLNQIERIVELLRSQQGTRRAVATVYHPEDAGRSSRDIPCHLGVAYNVRNGGLQASTIMRSCNAGRILPYDFFLFSLLAELVAVLVGVRLASYHQFTVSMHVYVDDLDRVRAGLGPDVDGVWLPPRPDLPPMPDLPSMPAGEVLDRIRRLTAIEARLRHAALTHAMDEPPSQSRLRSWLAWVDGDLDAYWASYAYALVPRAAAVAGAGAAALAELLDELRGRVFPAFANLL